MNRAKSQELFLSTAFGNSNPHKSKLPTEANDNQNAILKSLIKS